MTDNTNNNNDTHFNLNRPKFLPDNINLNELSNIDYTYPLNIFNSPILNEKYTEYPLNMLSEIYTFTNLELFFFFIILNTFLVEYIMKIDFNKYLPKNKIGKWLLFFINRYITN